jgi:ribosomal protein S27AE
MIYDIDGSFSDNDNSIYGFRTDLDTDYRISFKDSGEYKIIDIMILSDSKYDCEFFTTLKTIQTILLRDNNEKFILNIEGGDIYQRRRKLKVLSRWLSSFDQIIVENPQITSIGRGMSNITLNITQVFLTQKKEVRKRKFCPNCGSENNDYKFCPSCGTNLQ